MGLDPTRAELALALAKAKCFRTCGAAADPAVAAALHEEHRLELELAYKMAQEARGLSQPTNAASGVTQLSADLAVNAGLN